MPTLTDLARARADDPVTVEVGLRAHLAAHPDDRVAAARVALTGSTEGLGPRRLPELRWRYAPLAEALLGPVRAEESAEAWLLRSEIAHALGRPADALAAVEAAVRAAPADPEVHRRAAEAWRSRGDLDAAVAHARQARALAPYDARLADLAARLATLRDDPEAVDLVLSAYTLGAAPLDETLARLDALGAVAAAAELADPAWRARAALWRGEPGAEATLRGAPPADPGPDDAPADPAQEAVGAFLAAVASLCKPDASPTEAAASGGLLARVSAMPRPAWLTDAEIHAWRSEAARRAGDRGEAVAAASEAIAATPRDHVAAWILRALAAAGPGYPGATLDPGAWRPIADRLGERLGDVGTGTRRGEVLPALAAALDGFGGNRSATLTVPDAHAPAGLRAWRPAPFPRLEARRLQHLLRVRPAADVLAAFDALAARFPGDPTPRTYQGEVLLWLGRWPEAAAAFHDALALDRETVWAWIGLGAATLYAGDPAAALATWAEGVAAVGFEGPTLFPYRAEARWALGDRDGALADLDHALATKPDRPSAWMTRALMRGSRRHARDVAAIVRAGAPGLWVDAAQLADADPADLRAAPEVFPQALRLCRGNRSSTLLTWIPAEAAPARVHVWPAGRFEALREPER